MKRTVCLLLFWLPLLAVAQSDEVKIRAMMQQQEDGWNEGNLEKYMQGYLPDSALTFIGRSGITKGFAATLSNYKKSYPDKKAMGKLQFSLQELRPLGAGYYFVIGRWHLVREAGDLKGYFSLLLQKIDGEWFIIADHSS